MNYWFEILVRACRSDAIDEKSKWHQSWQPARSLFQPSIPSAIHLLSLVMCRLLHHPVIHLPMLESPDDRAIILLSWWQLTVSLFVFTSELCLMMWSRSMLSERQPQTVVAKPADEDINWLSGELCNIKQKSFLANDDLGMSTEDFIRILA